MIVFLFLDNFLYKYRHIMFRWVYLIQDGTSKLKADVDEGLSNYFHALSGIEQKLWYTNECYNRFNTGVKALSEESLEKLRTSQRNRHKKHIKGNASYKILFNIQYQQRFQYQPLDERNEKEDNILSDIITKMLNLNEHMSKPEIMMADGTMQARDDHIEDVHFASKGAIMKQLKKVGQHKKMTGAGAQLKNKMT